MKMPHKNTRMQIHVQIPVMKTVIKYKEQILQGKDLDFLNCLKSMKLTENSTISENNSYTDGDKDTWEVIDKCNASSFF